jgi:tetraprenyl-beta-curcumene synthase
MSFDTAITLARATPTYWCSVYPQVRRELADQRRRAAAIPRAPLRAVALEVLDSKRANIDGAAAFAVFAPRARRPAVIRAQVAFQSLYDYLDALAEQPHPDPVLESRRLHGALTAALDPCAPDGAQDAQPGDGEDGGYVQGTVERCRAALRALPGYPAVRAPAARFGAQIVDYQSFNVSQEPGPQAQFARWASQMTPPGCGLRWWETAASAGSSLGLFALIAMAAQPGVSSAEALAVERAYFPWIGALHSLLDSLIDLDEDRASGQRALIENYTDAGEAAWRLRLLAQESRRRAAALAHSDRHLLMLAAMASIYLAEPQAQDPHARAARRAVLRALGAPAITAMAVMRLRRAALSG